MSKLMKSVSGIRGIVGEALTAELAMQFAKQFGEFCTRGKILIGRDSRKTGKMLFQAISAGLLSVGCDVEDLGICPTPTILLEVENSDAMGGIAITASHNPRQWNAMKLIKGSGTFLTEADAEKFWEIDPKKVDELGWDQMGQLTQNTKAVENHIKKILALPYVDVEKIKAKNFKVVIDSTNGAGVAMSPVLLNKLGCEVIELYSAPTGEFSRVPEPQAKNLSSLENLVKEESADIGFATDPDVDRLSLVSDQGIALGTEYTLGLVEDFILSQNKGNIATNLSSSMISDRIAEKYNVKIFRSKVGEINVADKMKEHDCVIGGEGNGGIILPDLHYTRDAPMAMALILSSMAKTGNKLSQLAQKIPDFEFYKTSVPIDDELDFLQLQEGIKELFPEQEYDSTDGLKVVDQDFWVHIRKSGTEPIIRIFAESESEKKSKMLVQKIINLSNWKN